MPVGLVSGAIGRGRREVVNPVLPTLWASLRPRRGDLLAVALVFVAYSATVWVAYASSLTFALATGAANTVTVVIFAALARHLIRTRLIDRDLWIQAAGHAILCAIFSFGAYWLLLVMLGVANSPSPLNFSVKAFVTRGMAWQMLENVTTYAVVAALTYAQAANAAARLRHEPVAPPNAKEPGRFLVRSGDELRPIDIDRIVSISGADDYAELSTLDGKRLVAMTLAEFEAALDPARFVRVHRSRIVNLDFVDRAEPDGAGRLLLHLRSGETISSSRAGARLLRTRVI